MINYKLTKETKKKCLNGEIHEQSHRLTLLTFFKQKYNAKYIPNPYPYGSLKFETEKDLTMFLLKL